MTKKASIGVLVALPTDSPHTVQLFGCVFDARWVWSPKNADHVTLVVSLLDSATSPWTMDGTAKGS